MPSAAIFPAARAGREGKHMIYQIGSEVKRISITDIDPREITVGLISLDALKQHAARLGFTEATVNECENGRDNFRCTIDVYDEYSFGILNVLGPDVFGPRDRLGFYLKRNLFLLVRVVDDDQSTNEFFEQAIHRFRTTGITLEKLVFGVFDRLLANDNKRLENLEFAVGELEDEVARDDTDREFINDFLKLRKKLLLLRNYYEQLIDVGEALQENENDLFCEENLRYFKMFTDRAARLSAGVQALRENTVQVREAYQASMDLSFNRIMKVFTVVTAVFLPLTLIAGWYGMNFVNMPELQWQYGYPAVIALSVAVVGACLLWFKKKKLL